MRGRLDSMQRVSQRMAGGVETMKISLAEAKPMSEHPEVVAVHDELCRRLVQLTQDSRIAVAAASSLLIVVALAAKVPLDDLLQGFQAAARMSYDADAPAPDGVAPKC